MGDHRSTSEHQRTADAAYPTCAGECASLAPGHGLHPIRATAAAATTRWTDAIVESANTSGVIELVTVFTGRHHVVWSHHDAARTLRPGDAVALHQQYGILAMGRTRWSVRALDETT